MPEDSRKTIYDYGYGKDLNKQLGMGVDDPAVPNMFEDQVDPSLFLPGLSDSLIVFKRGIGYGIRTVTEDATFQENGIVLADPTSGTITLTLPPVEAAINRAFYAMKTDSGSNEVILDGNEAETINGAATVSLTSQYDKAMVVSDGTEWFRFT